MRTTIDLDPTILRELKQRAQTEKKTLGQLASELLAPALKEPAKPSADWHWGSDKLGLLIDIDDKEALWEILDADGYKA